MAELALPRFMLSAAGSGSGKTTLACALLRALLDRGLRVAAFKSGPDYIDPMFHSRVIGAHSRNLDLFMLGQATARYLAAKNAQNADIAVFEGAMGYYDGIGTSEAGSAYDLARTCGVPVILVVNGKGAALSIAAQIRGFKEFRPDSRIVGAILNYCKPMSYHYYQEVIEQESGVRLVGYFPPMEECNFASRHLGLVTAAEISDLQQIVARLAAQAEQSIDLAAVLELARAAEPLTYTPQPVASVGKVRIAIARDQAFCFYYQDALDLLAEYGAELVPFSPLADSDLPACSGLILGGGYPELYAEQLAANTALLAAIRRAVQAGMPCFAECGGFMYLLEKYLAQGQAFAWAGVLPGATQLTDRLTRFGYVQLTAQQDNLLCAAGETINGHEFHYSDSTNNGSAFTAVKASGRGSWPCCHAGKTLYAGYPHLHLCGRPHFARNFVAACCAYAASGAGSARLGG